LKIYVVHGSATTQLKCGGIFNNCLIAKCPGMRQWKRFENRLIFGEDIMNRDIVGWFLRHSVVPG